MNTDNPLNVDPDLALIAASDGLSVVKVQAIATLLLVQAVRDLAADIRLGIREES